MQVQVHDVHAEVAGPRHAHQGVHVGAVHVDQRIDAVQEVADLLEAVLEDAHGVGVGDHGPRDLGAQLGHQCPQALAGLAAGGIGDVVEGDSAVRQRGQLDDLIARHGGGGGVGTVATVRNEDDAALGAPADVIGANEHHARQLAGGAGAGLQGHAGQPRDLLQPFLKSVDQLQVALHQGVGRHGVTVGEAGQPRDLLVEPGVVLHGAGAERIDAVVHAVVPLGEAREVADDFHLAQLGQGREAAALQVGGAGVAGGGNIGLRQVHAPLAGDRALEGEGFALAQEHGHTSSARTGTRARISTRLSIIWRVCSSVAHHRMQPWYSG